MATAGGNGEKLQAIDGISGSVTKGGEVDGNTGGSTRGAVAKLTVVVSSPNPEIAGNVDSEGMINATSNLGDGAISQEISTSDSDSLATCDGATVWGDIGDCGGRKEVGVAIGESCGITKEVGERNVHESKVTGGSDASDGGGINYIDIYARSRANGDFRDGWHGLIERITRESCEVDGNVGVGGGIIAELAIIIISPHPEIAGNINGKGKAVTALTATGNVLELGTIDRIGDGGTVGGEVDGDIRTGGVATSAVTELTGEVISPSPEIARGVEG